MVVAEKNCTSCTIMMRAVVCGQLVCVLMPNIVAAASKRDCPRKLVYDAHAVDDLESQEIILSCGGSGELSR